MQGEIRVTVIATGFDKAAPLVAPAVEPMAAKGAPVIPLHAQRTPTIAAPEHRSSATSGAEYGHQRASSRSRASA